MAICGIVIEIPEPWRTIFHEARVQAGDPGATVMPPHITLVIPTSVPDESWENLEEHVKGVVERHRSFLIKIEGAGTFAPVTDVVYAKLSGGEMACQQLHQEMLTEILAQELEYPYHPHVTLAQNLDSARMKELYAQFDNFHAEFTVKDIALCRWDSDTWKVIRRYPLS